MATKWFKAGEIPVDGGQMMFVDPSYLREGIDFEEVISRQLQTGALTALRVNDEAVIPLAAVFNTGHGDGLYPVELEIDEMGTVCAARIIFTAESEIEEIE